LVYMLKNDGAFEFFEIGERPCRGSVDSKFGRILGQCIGFK